jgi:hypothetical protein
MLPENTTAPEKEKKPRHRSPNYPAIGLRAAAGKITAMYKEDGLAPSPKLAALKHMGFEKAHGEAMRVLSAIKSFGLAEDANERIRLTQRGINIVARPEDDPQRMQALQDALTGPEIYRELLREYQTSGLPSETSLKSELIADKKFNPNSVDGFIRDFKDSLEFSRISDLNVLELSVETQEEDDQMNATDEIQAVRPPQPQRTVVAPSNPVSRQQIPPVLAGEIATPVGKDGDTVVFANVRFSAGLRKEYVASLKKYLEYLETTLQ